MSSNGRSYQKFDGCAVRPTGSRTVIYVSNKLTRVAMRTKAKANFPSSTPNTATTCKVATCCKMD